MRLLDVCPRCLRLLICGWLGYVGLVGVTVTHVTVVTHGCCYVRWVCILRFTRLPHGCTLDTHVAPHIWVAGYVTVLRWFCGYVTHLLLPFGYIRFGWLRYHVTVGYVYVIWFDTFTVVGYVAG